MRTMFLVILICVLSCIAFSQQEDTVRPQSAFDMMTNVRIVNQFYNDSTGNYLLTFQFNELRPRREHRHFPAEITVYRLVGPQRFQIGEPFKGHFGPRVNLQRQVMKAKGEIPINNRGQH